MAKRKSKGNYLAKQLKSGQIPTKRKTHQSKPIPGRESDQVENRAGGFVFKITQWEQLNRFLILGTEGNTYYAREAEMTEENTTNLRKCLKEDGPRVVSTIVDISDSGRAAKNTPAIYALALAMSEGDETTKKAAELAMPKVIRIGTHLFQLINFVNALRGWGRYLKRVVANFYLKKPLPKLVYQVLKYRNREGWTHRDALRLSHPKVDKTDKARSQLLKWVVKEGKEYFEKDTSEDLKMVEGYISINYCKDISLYPDFITKYKLPRECVPTDGLKDPDVWKALLPHMGLTAKIRNLGNMTKLEVVKPLSKELGDIVKSLTSLEELKKGRIHPIHILTALRTYEQGHGFKGKSTWTPIPQIIDALDKAFYLAFKTVTPTGKRFLLGLDVSGSMGWGEIAGMSGLTPREASVALALVTANVEPMYHIMGFTGNFVPLPISKGQRLDDAIRKVASLPFDMTDCAIPMLYALQHKIEVDCFVIYTDNESWSGHIHPTQALVKYRNVMGIPAKLIAVGMTATEYSVGDPQDAGTLNLVGFDSNGPKIISDFAAAPLT